jgi:pyrroline-5-carboxylate reductase
MTEGFRYEGTLAVIGGGKMGEAIVAGLIDAGAVPAKSVTIADPNAGRRELLTRDYGVRTVADGADALPADAVLIAVKPQVIDEVVGSLAASLASSLIVSIAAGITLARLESLLPAGTAVVRVMPNTPALVGEGMAIISGGTEATAAQVATISSLFSAIGHAIVLEEKFQDAAAAISGCGPAYVALIVDALARAGVAQGLPRATAQELALQTVRGTAELIITTGEHPEAVIDMVTSPGGTTIAAINVLESRGVRAAFADAVAAAVKRSKELGS